MKRLLATLLLALPFASASASGLQNLPFRFEVSGGLTLQGAPPSGTWWEDQYSHKFNLISPNWGFGITGKVNSWSTWHLDYQDLGAASTHGMACSSQAQSSNIDDCAKIGMATSHWNGYQHPHGVWATWEPSYKRVFMQLGAGYYQDRFSMYIPDFQWSPNNTAPFRTFNAEVDDEHKWHASYIIGVGLHLNKHFDVVLNNRGIHEANANQCQCAFVNGTNHWPGQYESFSHSAWALSLRYAF